MTTKETGIAFEASIIDVVKAALRITRRDPRFAFHALRLLRRQQNAAKIRGSHEAAGTHVPPFLIYSVTGRCNFDCTGCYANILHRSERQELSSDRIHGLLDEARVLGSSIMLLAGGEPFLRPDLLELTSRRPEILFLLFTNGSLLTDERIEALRRQRHVITVLSLEGNEAQTDARRGSGTYGNVLNVMSRMKRRRVFFGTSTTLTSENIELTTSQGHLEDLIDRGCRLFYYINYVPVQPGTEGLQLSPAQVQALEERLTDVRKTLPALFIAFPHDEVALGGCLAAGRGFLHINAYGDVEPCPFSPCSDTNLTETSLQEALASPLLRHILESGVALDETDGCCALWKRRDWVKRLLEGGADGGVRPPRVPGGTGDRNPSPDRLPLPSRP